MHPQHDYIEVVLGIGPANYYEAVINQKEFVEKQNQIKIADSKRIEQLRLRIYGKKRK